MTRLSLGWFTYLRCPLKTTCQTSERLSVDSLSENSKRICFLREPCSCYPSIQVDNGHLWGKTSPTEFGLLEVTSDEPTRDCSRCQKMVLDYIVRDVYISRLLIHDGITCKRDRGKPVQQKMAALPELRVHPCSPPFQTTLIDYWEPVNVKLNQNNTSKPVLCSRM